MSTPLATDMLRKAQEAIIRCTHCGQRNRVFEQGALVTYMCGKCRIHLSVPFKYVVFDCETTGLPSGRSNPHLVQLAWSVIGIDGTPIAERNYIVKPNGYSIPEASTSVHGITDQQARKDGVPLSHVIESFLLAADAEGVRLVAHNIDFDTRVIGAEIEHVGFKSRFIDRPRYCTMRNTVDLCRIPRRGGGYKWPSLQELHLHLFRQHFQGGHNAMQDVQATARCFIELCRRKFVTYG